MKNKLSEIPTPASGFYLVFSIDPRKGGDISEVRQVKAASYLDALSVATKNDGMGFNIYDRIFHVVSMDGDTWGKLRVDLRELKPR
jgi:hypothetical protein